MTSKPTSHAEPLRVIVVGQTPPPYGGQAVMLQLLLKGSYRQIRLFHARMKFSEDLDGNGKFRVAKLFELFRVISRIYWIKFRLRPDVLYYPPSGPRFLPVMRDIVILGTCRWLFRYTVFHFHASGVSDYADRLPAPIRALFRCTFDKPDLAIRISAKAPDEGLRLHCGREIIVANGIPDSCNTAILRREAHPNPLRVLFVGLLSEDKGIVVAVQAVQTLLRAGFQLELTALGRWGSAEVERLVRNYIEPQYSASYSFPGVVVGEEKWHYYRQADIFLFPSFFHSETFPVVLLEAMCFSLPIVTTSWRGIPDVVEDGRSAVLCEPRSVERCTDALQMLVESPEIRGRMSIEARARFLKYFTIDAHLLAMEHALSTVRG